MSASRSALRLWSCVTTIAEDFSRADRQITTLQIYSIMTKTRSKTPPTICKVCKGCEFNCVDYCAYPGLPLSLFDFAETEALLENREIIAIVLRSVTRADLQNGKGSARAALHIAKHSGKCKYRVPTKNKTPR